MKNFLAAFYKMLYGLAIDIIAVTVVFAFFALVWNVSKVFAIITCALFVLAVYLEANKVDREGD